MHLQINLFGCKISKYIYIFQDYIYVLYISCQLHLGMSSNQGTSKISMGHGDSRRAPSTFWAPTLEAPLVMKQTHLVTRNHLAWKARKTQDQTVDHNLKCENFLKSVIKGGESLAQADARNGVGKTVSASPGVPLL